MSVISFGVLGFGRHTEKVISAFSRCGQGRIAAIGTSSEEKILQSQTRRLPFELCSYDKLLELPQIDAVYIALPNHLHEKWIIRALEAGKHVICEKPLCVEKAELERIEDCLKSTQLFFHLGFMYRFHPQHAWVKRFLAEGKLGVPYLLEAHFHYSLADRENIRFKRETGGGGLLDVGCYLLDCAEFLFQSSPLSISGHWHLDPEAQVDLSAHLQVVYENNLTAHLSCGMNQARANSYSIFGSAGTLTVRNAFRVEPNQKTIIEWTKLDGSSELVQFSGIDQNALQFDAFAERIQKQKRPPDDALFTDGLNNMKHLLAAREACERN